MKECWGTISSVSQAAGVVLEALGNLISNFEYTLELEPYIKGGQFDLWEWVTSGGASGIKLPSIGFNSTGHGGTAVSDFTNALGSAAEYL